MTLPRHKSTLRSRRTEGIAFDKNEPSFSEELKRMLKEKKERDQVKRRSLESDLKKMLKGEKKPSEFDTTLKRLLENQKLTSWRPFGKQTEDYELNPVREVVAEIRKTKHGKTKHGGRSNGRKTRRRTPRRPA
jgi:hypothetical protein